jgi:hypothetical protein
LPLTPVSAKFLFVYASRFFNQKVEKLKSEINNNF